MVQESAKATKLGTIRRVLVLEASDWPDLAAGDGLPRTLGIVLAVSSPFMADGVLKRRVETEWAPTPPPKAEKR